MSNDERFSKFFFGILLIASCVVAWGRWVALGIGVLFLLSSLQRICVGCKCKEAVHHINQKDKN